MASSLASLAARLTRLPRRIVDDGARRFDQIAKAAAGRAVPGGRMRLHMAGGVVSPVELGTESKINEAPGAAEGFVVGRPFGPWVWLEHGTKEHWIAPRAALGRLGGPFMDHPVSGPVLHPGITGQGTWNEAVGEYDAEAGLRADLITEEVING